MLALPATALGANGAYDEPRFVLGGSKIAVSIYDASDAGEGSYLGMVLIDIASGESEHYFPELARGAFPVYPIADRFFTIQQGNYITMADAQTGETKVIHSADAPAPIFADKNPGGQNSPNFTLDSYDFQTLILAQSPLQQGTTIFAGDATATRTLATIPAPCFARLDAVLQTHAVLSVTDIDGSWLALLPY